MHVRHSPPLPEQREEREGCPGSGGLCHPAPWRRPGLGHAFVGDRIFPVSGCPVANLWSKQRFWTMWDGPRVLTLFFTWLPARS